MFESIRRLFGSVAKGRAHNRNRREGAAPRRRNQPRLGVERLEERALMAADLNDQMREASFVWTMSRTEPSFVQGTIAGGSDVSMYSIYANAGEYVEFNLDKVNPTTQNLDAYLRIFDANGREISRNDDGPAPREGRSSEPYILQKFTTSGNYYIGVSDWHNKTYDPRNGTWDYMGNQGTSGQFELMIQRRGNDLHDQMFEAWDMSEGTYGYVTRGEVDMYRGWFEAGQRYTISTFRASFSNDADPSNFAIRVFDRNGVEVKRTGMVYQFANTGYYYVGISCKENTGYDARDGLWDNTTGVGGRYSWRVNTVYGPVFHTTKLFTNGVTDFDTGQSDYDFPGSVTGSEVRMYSFQVKSEGYVAIHAFAPDSSILHAPVQLRLFDRNGNQIAASGVQAQIRMEKLAPGWYYIGVSTLKNNAYKPMTGEGLVWGASGGPYDLFVSRPGF
jgi:hypothetical protein